MELYHKKINMKNRKDKNNNNRFNKKDSELSQKLNKSVYLQKMLKRKNPTPKNDLNLSTQNDQKVFSNVEKLFNNDNTKNKAIKYVIQIGKTKPIKQSLNRNIYQLMNYQNKKFKTIDNDNKTKTKESIEETPLDMDISLSNEEGNDNMNYTQRDKLRQIPEANNRLSKSLERRNIRKNEDKNAKKLNNKQEDLTKLIEELQEMNNNLRKDSIK